MVDSNISTFPSRRAIAVSRLVFLILVVLIHCHFVPYKDEGYIFGEDVVIFVSELLTALAVPGFFFISGGLFFRNLRGNIGAKLKRRVYSLLIPYLLWNGFGMLIFVLKRTLLASYIPDMPSATLSFVNLIKGFWAVDLIGVEIYPYDYALWFVRNLIVLMIVAVPIYRLLGVNKWLLLACACAMPFTDQFQNYGLVYSFFYFYAGGVFFKYAEKFKFIHMPKPALLKCVAIGGTTLWLIWCMAWQYGLVNGRAVFVPILLGIVGIMSAMQLLTTRYSSSMGPSNIYLRSLFFVYAIHGYLCINLCRIVKRWFYPDTTIGCLVTYFAVFAIAWYGSMALFMVCDKLFPRLTRLLTGGRD